MTTRKDSRVSRQATFLLDGMLGSLARKLRILGFDTLYDSESNDSELLSIAKRTKRHLVTSDVELYLNATRKKIDSILICSRSERGRLYEVLSRIGESRIDYSRAARCSLCNGQLEGSGSYNGKTLYTCVACGKDYWRGSHWKRLTSLFQEVDLMLQKKRNAQD